MKFKLIKTLLNGTITPSVLYVYLDVINSFIELKV
jgi:hypothetical protein